MRKIGSLTTAGDAQVTKDVRAARARRRSSPAPGVKPETNENGGRMRRVASEVSCTAAASAASAASSGSLTQDKRNILGGGNTWGLSKDRNKRRAPANQVGKGTAVAAPAAGGASKALPTIASDAHSAKTRRSVFARRRPSSMVTDVADQGSGRDGFRDGRCLGIDGRKGPDWSKPWSVGRSGLGGGGGSGGSSSSDLGTRPGRYSPSTWAGSSSAVTDGRSARLGELARKERQWSR